MPGDVCRDEAVTDPETNFKINFVYTFMIHTGCFRWSQDFVNSLQLQKDLPCFNQLRHFENEDAEEKFEKN